MRTLPENLLHWAARISGLITVGFFSFLFLNEFTSPHGNPPVTFVEWIGILLLTLACVGMLIAWREELLGASISLLALLALMLMVTFNQYAAVGILAIPGTLYLLDWSLRYHRIHRYPRIHRSA